MAKYLWVGRDYSDVSPTSLRVDKYCWNTPGNWKVKQNIGGVNQWVATQDVPGAGDDAVIGGEVQASNDIRYAAQLPGVSGEAPGWVPAKCPLLFGGYSGGVGAGTWSHTGPTAVVGNTWTNSLNTLTFSANGYGKQGFFGGGIREMESDEQYSVFNFILPRDLLHGSGITEGFYYTNSAGFRDPREGLKLKVKNIVNLNNPMEYGWYQSNNNITYGWQNVYLLCDIDFVKAYSQTGISGSPGTVATILDIHTPRGPLVKINGGSFRFINFNTELGAARADDRAFAQQIEGINPPPFERVTRLNLNGVFAENIFAKKAGFIKINGGTAARVFLSQYPYMVSNNYFENINQPWRGGLTTDAGNEATAIISCDFNKHAVQLDHTGRTSGSQAGDLYLEGTPFSLNNGSTSAPYERSSYGSVWNDEYSRFNLTSSAKAQRVLIEKSGGIYIPYIKIVSVLDLQGLQFQRSSWELQFGSSANVDRIDNEGGFIYSAPTLSNFATVKIGELHLSKYGRIDFGKNNQEFDDWRIGGLTANFILGGIIMDDGNGIIDGSAGVRLIPTFQLSGAAERRSASPTAPSKLLETPYESSKITK